MMVVSEYLDNLSWTLLYKKKHGTDKIKNEKKANERKVKVRSSEFEKMRISFREKYRV